MCYVWVLLLRKYTFLNSLELLRLFFAQKTSTFILLIRTQFSVEEISVCYVVGLDVSPLKWRVCWCGLNRFVHEGMSHISNVKVHLKTRSGNVSITVIISYLSYQLHCCALPDKRCLSHGMLPLSGHDDVALFE